MKSMRPLVVALMGLPGSGKSTLARALAPALDLHLVDRDALRAAMFPRCSFSMAEKLAALRMLLAAVEVNCALGRSSIVDGMTFARRADREQLASVVCRYPVDLVAIHLECAPDLARARVAADCAGAVHAAADRTPQLVDEVAARFDPPPADALVLDATLAPEVLLEQALLALRQRVFAP